MIFNPCTIILLFRFFSFLFVVWFVFFFFFFFCRQLFPLIRVVRRFAKYVLCRRIEGEHRNYREWKR